jgi:signal transduction histidine kinase
MRRPDPASEARRWVELMHTALGNWPHRVWIAEGSPLVLRAEAGAPLEPPPADLPAAGRLPLRLRTSGAVHVVLNVAADVTIGLTVPPDRQHPLLDGILLLGGELWERQGLLRRLDWEAQALAHEMRNPLMLLGGYAELLGERGETDLARLLQEEIRRMDQSIEEFLMAGRDPRRQPVDVAQLVHEVADRHRPYAERHGVSVVERLEPAVVEADPVQIQSVVANLVRNALEAMSTGGVLTLVARPAPGGVEIVVRDTGPGLAHEMLDQLFAPYVSTKPGGHGLGLARAQEIVARHGGSLVALPDSGGAAFRVFLPRGGEGGE